MAALTAGATHTVDLGPTRSVLVRGCALVTVAGEQILVLRAGRRFYALSNTCPHLGLPLDDGKVVGQTLTCASHGFRYDLRAGCGMSSWRGRPPGALSMLPVEERDGHLFVTVSAATAAAS